MPLEEFIITVFCWVETAFEDATAGITGYRQAPCWGFLQWKTFPPLKVNSVRVKH